MPDQTPGETAWLEECGSATQNWLQVSAPRRSRISSRAWEGCGQGADRVRLWTRQAIDYTAHQGGGPAVFAEACRMGLDGIVSKRLGSHYRSGKCGDWRKIKDLAYSWS